MKKYKPLPPLAIIFYYTMGGFDFIIIDQLTKVISPITLIFLRFLLAAIVLACYASIRKISLKVRKQDFLRIALCGAVGFSLYYTLEAVGIEKTSGSLASLILALIPFFGLAADRLICKNKISRTKGICAGGSMIGVFLIVKGTTGAELTGTVWGIFIMFLAALSWTAYIFLVKPLEKRYDLVTLAANLFFVGVIIELPLFMLYGPAEILRLGGSDWAILIASAAVCIVLGQLAYIYGVGNVSATVASLYANLLPFVTVAFSFLIFGQLLSVQQLIGGIIILAAVTLSSIVQDERERKNADTGSMGKIE